MSEPLPKMATLRPITDPLELRDRTMRDYANNVRRAGNEPDMEAIRIVAEADLGIVDRHNAEAKPVRVKKDKPARIRTEDDPLTKHERENNVTIQTRPVGQQPERPKSFMDLPSHLVSAKWAAAQARILRIIQPRDDVREMAKGGYEAVAKNAAHPRLATKFVNVFGFYLVPGHRSKHNPFRNLRGADIHRAFMRIVEDICDESTGALGPWWVK